VSAAREAVGLAAGPAVAGVVTTTGGKVAGGDVVEASWASAGREPSITQAKEKFRVRLKYRQNARSLAASGTTHDIIDLER